MGSNKRPFFRIVVVDSRMSGKGRLVETLGSYRPRDPKEQIINLNKDSAMSWIQKGATPSQSVLDILEKQGVVPKGSVTPGR